MRGCYFLMAILLVLSPQPGRGQSPAPGRPAVDREPVGTEDPEESASTPMVNEPEGDLEENTEGGKTRRAPAAEAEEGADEEAAPGRRSRRSHRSRPDRSRSARATEADDSEEATEEAGAEESEDAGDAAAAAGTARPPRVRGPAFDPERGPGRLLTAIGVSGLQKVQLVAAFLKGAARMSGPCSSLGALRLEIIGELIAEKPDEKKLETALGELQTKLDEVIVRAVDLLFDLRGALTPEQNAKAIEVVITERLERGHRPPPMGRGPGRDRLGAVRAALEAADLDPRQQAEIKRLLVARTPFFLRATGATMEKGFELAALLCDANATKDAVLALAKAIGGSVMEAIREGVVLALDVRDLLSAEQQETFVAHLDLAILLRPSMFDPHGGPPHGGDHDPGRDFRRKPPTRRRPPPRGGRWTERPFGRGEEM